MHCNQEGVDFMYMKAVVSQGEWGDVDHARVESKICLRCHLVNTIVGLGELRVHISEVNYALCSLILKSIQVALSYSPSDCHLQQ